MGRVEHLGGQYGKIAGAGRHVKDVPGVKRCQLTDGLAPPIFINIPRQARSEEHTSELQSRQYLVCRLLLEKKKKKNFSHSFDPHSILIPVLNALSQKHSIAILTLSDPHTSAFITIMLATERQSLIYSLIHR